MVDLNSTRLIITLNVNGLKTPIKSQRLPDQIKKVRSYHMLCRSKSLQIYSQDRLKLKRGKKIYYVNINYKKVEVAILASDNTCNIKGIYQE